MVARDYGFPVVANPDTMPYRGSGAASVHGHPDRCKAALRSSIREARSKGLPLEYPHVKQCGHFAKKGRDYCQYHGGTISSQNTVKAESLAKRYLRNAGPQLKAILETYAKESPDQKHSLDEEVDAARLLAEQAMIMYDVTVVQSKGSPEQQAFASDNLKASLLHVGDIVAKAARVRSQSQGVVDTEMLAYIVAQITDIIEQEVREKNSYLADKIVERLNGIALPTKESDGDKGLVTRLQAALKEIDDTVPDS